MGGYRAVRFPAVGLPRRRHGRRDVRRDRDRGGPDGENAADRAVRGGLSAVIVESELVGGECSYWACMPSKALLRPAGAVAEAAEVLARRNAFAHDWSDDGQVQWLKSAKVTLVRGHGRLTGERRVSVGDRTL